MIEVIDPGFYTSVQDRGRQWYRSIGVPSSGAMDQYSAQFANLILGNKVDMAVLEITMKGPKLRFTKPTVISISGAIMNVLLNGVILKQNTIIEIGTGDILECGNTLKGFRSYMSIKGGFHTSESLGSRSYYKGITSRSHLHKGQVLNYIAHSSLPVLKNATIKFDKTILETNLLDVHWGPEYKLLNRHQQNDLFTKSFKISNKNNRMGYRLDTLIENNLRSIVTSPVLPGTVQLTPSGHLMILMRDSQTSGGYPRVLQLHEESINILSQRQTGEAIKFRLKPL